MTLSSYLGLLAVSAVLAVTPGQDTMLSLRNALVSRRAGLGAATGSSVAALIWAALAATGLAALFQASPVAYELLSLIGGLYVIFLGLRAVRSARIMLRSHPRARARGRVPALVGGPHDPQPSAVAPHPVMTDPVTTDPVATHPSTGVTDAPKRDLSAAEQSDDARGTPPGAPRPAGRRPRRETTSFRSTFLIGLASCMTNPKVGLFFLALFPQFTPVGASPAFAIGVLGGTVAASMWLYLIGVVLLVDAANTWLSNPVVTGRIELGSGLTLAGLGIYLSVSGVLGLLS
ncbi:threonine/homoserine/homoserine lactone efflux protein [Nesterenkonia sandarakina]|uniref:Threonine/homoserine/homoserine lactone efflux protein n=1 Tax=Nesterenkonia sandarakina TaxID=272918 RepID=A0A7Z0EAL1_9MICC|nr:LysE family translocator [Nesterenkonia sandarakina]NYJ17956.1 threonine/homoserine/homoserine lactone efflux protein [Nesterenkonia sandarakina]